MASSRNNCEYVDRLLVSEAAEVENDEETLCWYHGDISRETAMERLQAGLDCLIRDFKYLDSVDEGRMCLKTFPQEDPVCVKSILTCRFCPDIDAKDSQGFAALHLAASIGDETLVEMLLDAGAIVDLRAATGHSALHMACERNHVRVARLLLEIGQCEPDCRCTLTGWTPLHAAADAGSTDCVQVLLEYGADPTVTSDDMETPADLARKHGDSRSELLQVLEKLESEDEAEGSSMDSEEPIYVNVNTITSSVDEAEGNGDSDSRERYVNINTVISEHGSDPTTTSNDMETPADLARSELLQESYEADDEEEDSEDEDSRDPVYINLNTPLYQWITTEEIIQSRTRLSRGAEPETEKDRGGVEEVVRMLERCGSGSVGRRLHSVHSQRERREVIRDIFSESGSLFRPAWMKMRKVIDSGVLASMTLEEIKLQEAMFEILTTEASYQKSLQVLKSVFLKAPEFTLQDDRCLVSRNDYQALFSNIADITKSSARFLEELEDLWQKSCVLNDICGIMSRHAHTTFRVYIRYCSNQIFQDRTLKQLKTQHKFAEALRRFESHPACQSLSLGSFLLLPMQRVTRFPMLVDAILKRLDPGSPRHASASQALDRLKSLAKECDEGARRMQNAEEMLHLRNTLSFEGIQEFPLVSSSRCLVKKGRLTMVTIQKGTIASRESIRKIPLDAFLFTDVLLLTRKDGETFRVENWCLRNNLDVHDTKKMRWLSGVTGFSLFLSLKSNHEDLTLLECVVRYIAQEPDEITLELADVATLLRRTDDGWYWGERIRDSQRGWFPADHTEVIVNEQVRQHYLHMLEGQTTGVRHRSSSNVEDSGSGSDGIIESTRL